MNNFKKFRKNLSYTLPFSAIIGIIVILFYGIIIVILNAFNDADILVDYLIAIIGIIIFLFVLEPFLYSYLACNTMLDSPKREEVKPTSLIKTAKFGFNHPFRGQLNFISTTLFTILIYLGINLVVSMIGSFIALRFDQSLSSIINDFTNATYTNNATALEDSLNALSSNFAYQIVFAVSEAIGLIFALYYFVVKMLKNHFKFLFASAFPMIMPRIVSYIFKLVIKEHRKEFNKSFYKNAWPSIVAYFTGFIAGYLISFFLMYSTTNSIASVNFFILSASSIALGFVVSLPFYPIIYNLYVNEYNKYMNYFTNKFVTEISDEINFAKGKFTSEEDKNTINQAEDRLNQFKKQMGLDDKNEESTDVKNEDLKDKENDDKKE